MTEPTDSQQAPPPSAGDRRARATTAETSLAGLGFGLAILAIGVWYFLDQTLGLEMPRIDWRSAWPVFLIVIGAVLVFRSAGRRD
jgi:hypothetical protein